MPIDYYKYPPNWLEEIRPTIMHRANNMCECEGCDFNEANSQPMTIESRRNKMTGRVK